MCRTIRFLVFFATQLYVLLLLLSLFFLSFFLLSNVQRTYNYKKIFGANVKVPAHRQTCNWQFSGEMIKSFIKWKLNWCVILWFCCCWLVVRCFHITFACYRLCNRHHQHYVTILKMPSHLELEFYEQEHDSEYNFMWFNFWGQTS